jgi:transcription initiation factor TFIIIB Brf1 subunit/transcription initiation factor TFIIB
MKTRKLEIKCPECGSGEVFYSCTPGCCFNHVCSDCGTTFETLTTASGSTLEAIAAPEALPDATDPTAACARCDSIAVYQLEDGALVCSQCGAVLALELTEIHKG